MRIRPRPWLLVLAGFACGCAGVSRGTGDAERPKTLLTWAAGKEPDDKKKSDGDGMGNGGKNGDGGEGGDSKVERSPGSDGRDDPLVTDRPDFTEASSTVGKGRIQLEGGYTFVRDRSGGATTNGHSYPEALLRVGVLADWLEFRVGQNFGNTRTGGGAGRARDERRGRHERRGQRRRAGRRGHGGGAATRMNGAEDLYLGAKFALTEQKRALPETALILQGTVPTGSRDLTAGEVQPGVNFLYSWTVIEDRLSLGGSLQANRAIDDTGHGYVEVAQSLTGYGLTDKLGAYTEWFAFYPTGAIAPGVGPQHFFNGGFTYQFTPNLQFDIRAGVGLNRQADDFFVGTGFAIRY